MPLRCVHYASAIVGFAAVGAAALWLAHDRPFDSLSSLRTDPSIRLARSGRALRLAALAQDRPLMVAQEQGPTARPFSVTASRYKFEPARLEVFQDDVVQIDLRTEDIAHSWTVDEYRIAKRVGPGHPVTFEFRADRRGKFRFYCTLQTEDGCRQMHGELVVKPRK